MLERFFAWSLDVLAFVTPVSIAATNIIFLPIAAVWIFGMRKTQSRWPAVNGAPELMFLVFLGVSAVSAWAGMDKARSFRVIGNSDFYITIAVLLVALVRDSKQNERLLRIFMAAGLLTALWGLIQYAIGVNQSDKSNGLFLHLPSYAQHWPRPLLDELSMVNGRLIGTRSHPLHYAECLLFHWGIGIAYLLLSSGRQTIKWFIYLGVTGLALLFSQSRGPWIAAAAMLLAGACLLPTRRAWGLVGLSAVICAVFFVVPGLHERAASIADNTHHSNRDRINMWKAGMQLWRENPALGIGPGNVKKASPPFQLEEDRRWGPWGHLHSTYINILAERGALGLLALSALIGALVREIWMARRRASTLHHTALYNGALLGILGFLLSGVTETAYNTAVVMMMFYFVVGLALALARHENA